MYAQVHTPFGEERSKKKFNSTEAEAEQSSVNTLGHNSHPEPLLPLLSLSLGFVLEQLAVHNVLTMSDPYRQQE